VTIGVGDRLEIHELMARYDMAEDSGDLAGWVATFSRDGGFVGRRTGVTVTGHADLLAFAVERAARPDIGTYLHRTTNIIIDEAAFGATAQSCVMMIAKSDNGTYSVRGVAIKTDELVREDGRWRFRLRINNPWPECWEHTTYTGAEKA